MRRVIGRGVAVALLAGTVLAAPQLRADEWTTLSSALPVAPRQPVDTAGVPSEALLAAEIPPVPARPDIASERFMVQAISLPDIEERPQHDLTRDRLERLANERLSELTYSQQIAERGFSDPEVERILAKIAEIRTRSDDSQLARIRLINSLIRELDAIEAERGIGVDGLEEIARDLQQVYRDAGYLFARVIIPAQDVSDGVVRLQVLEGRLGEVNVAQNDVYSDEVVAAALQPLLGKVVYKDELDEAMRIVNDIDGLNAFGQFEPGKEVGATDLKILVSDERRWSSSFGMNNYGSSVTGKTRAQAFASGYDLAGFGDTLTLGVLRSEGPNEITLGSVNYRLPMWDPRHWAQLSVETNSFTVGLTSVVQIDTETTDYALDYGYVITRTQDLSLDATATAFYKDSVLDVLVSGSRIDQVSTDQHMAGGEVGLTYELLLRKWNTVLNGVTSARVGNIVKGALQPNDPDFDGQDTNYYMLGQELLTFTVFDVPWRKETKTRHALMFRLNTQLSEQFLPAVEQFGLGGSERVRGYLPDDISVDQAVYAGVQFYTYLPESLSPRVPWLDQNLGDIFKPYVFFDYAYGVRRAQSLDSSTDDDQWARLSGYGAGVDYYLFPDSAGNYDLRGTIAVAFPSSSKFSDANLDATGDSKVHVYLNLTFDLDGDRFDRMRRLVTP